MEKKDKLYTLTIFSENVAGVLNQVTNVFTRRQVNIESLNVSASGLEGIHRYTITCWSSETNIEKLTKQIEKKIDVVKAEFFTSEEIFIMETSLFKLSTAKILENRGISKAIRLHDAKIVEVNSTYSIVSLDGLTKDIVSLYNIFKKYNCLLQFVRSGAIAITKSKREKLNEFLELRSQEESMK